MCLQYSGGDDATEVSAAAMAAEPITVNYMTTPVTHILTSSDLNVPLVPPAPVRVLSLGDVGPAAAGAGLLTHAALPAAIALLPGPVGAAAVGAALGGIQASLLGIQASIQANMQAIQDTRTSILAKVNDVAVTAANARRLGEAPLVMRPKTRAGAGPPLPGQPAPAAVPPGQVGQFWDMAAGVAVAAAPAITHTHLFSAAVTHAHLSRAAVFYNEPFGIVAADNLAARKTKIALWLGTR